MAREDAKYTSAEELIPDMAFWNAKIEQVSVRLQSIKTK